MTLNFSYKELQDITNRTDLIEISKDGFTVNTHSLEVDKLYKFEYDKDEYVIKRLENNSVEMGMIE